VLRPDIYDIASWRPQGLRMVGNKCDPGHLGDRRKMLRAGIQRVSVSIDGLDAGSPTGFGAFQVPLAFHGWDEAMKRLGWNFRLTPPSQRPTSNS